MKTVRAVGVRFKEVAPIYYFDPGDLSLQPGDYVIVDTARGIEFGQVVQGERVLPAQELVLPLKKVLRRATKRDMEQLEENRKKEQHSFRICAEKIREHNLEMDLIAVEHTFDGSRIIFYFTAEGRVDFRGLVKDLACALRTRIELRQIGVRDEAKMIGGLGPCGRPICCASFLCQFQPVSIRLAKQQALSLNPAKISGLCGRLMCCLRFEQEYYGNVQAELPNPGQKVTTAEGSGRVVSVNAIKRTVTVALDEDLVMEFPAEEVEEMK